MGAVVRSRLSRRLLVTSATGALADWTVFATLVTLVARLTGGSVFAVAMVTCARLLPSVILSPLLAPYAGVIGTRRTLALADAARAAMVASLPLMTTLPRLAVVLLGLEFAAAISAATRESAISAGVDPALFSRFNTATGVVSYGMLPIGGLTAAALGGVAVGLPFLAAAVLLAAGAVIVALTTDIDGNDPVRPGRARDVSVLGGMRTLRRLEPFRDIVAVATLGAMAIAMLFSVGAAVATDVFGGVDRYGYLLAVLGSGALVGARLANTGQSAASGFVLALIGSVLLATPLAIPAIFLIGLGAAITYVETQSRLQLTASRPEEFAAAFALIKIGTALALVLAPAAYALGGTALVASAMVLVAGAGAGCYARRIERRSVAALALATIGRPLLRAAVCVRVQGRFPAGGAVVASNHPNVLDGPLVMALEDRIRPVARPQRMLLVRLALRWSGSIIVGTQAVDRAVVHLRSGGLVWLAPEGRMTGERFGRGRSGAARMALAAAVPLVPVAICYAGVRVTGSGGFSGVPSAVGPVGAVGPRLRDWRPWRRPQVTVVVGEAIPVQETSAAEEITAALMEQLSRMTGVPLEREAEPVSLAA